MTIRYAQCFNELRDKREGAFVPFTVLGDPDPETSLALLDAMVVGGADMLELGIPFSDPVADGPVIQAADCRALAMGVDPGVAFSLLAEFRRRHATTPVGLLLYANLIHRAGADRFYRRAARAGVDSTVVADLPLEEAGPFQAAAKDAGVGSVNLVTPNMSTERLARSVRQPAPYVYVVSRLGVTGKDESLSRSAGRLLRRIHEHQAPPSLLGFGIGRPEQVKAAIDTGADGAISGSAVVELIATEVGDNSRPIGSTARRRLAARVEEFVAIMKRATRR